MYPSPAVWTRRTRPFVAPTLVVATVVGACVACTDAPSGPSLQEHAPAAIPASAHASVADVSVFYTGLDNPRGMRFGPDGNLYVAEGGVGGSTNTTGQCQQVRGPIGPYLGSPTGSRISRITPAGVRTTVASGLPSSQTQAVPAPLVSGVADVEFVNGVLYGLLTGAGCSHGVPSVPNQVFRVNANGTWTTVANLSAWYQANPTAVTEEDDFEPDGTPYSMVGVRGDL